MSDTLNRTGTEQVQSPRHYLDTAPMPEWGKAPDGKMAKIGEDARLPALFAQWQDDACEHSKTVVVRKNDSLGRHQYFRFCEQCGLKMSSAIAHREAGIVSDYTADDMEEKASAYLRERQEHLDRITGQAAERAQSEIRVSYADYLRSDAWKRRAAKIIERANGVCEGCLTRPASDVHHLTYAHVRNEFAFELVALCRPCHTRYHDEGAE